MKNRLIVFVLLLMTAFPILVFCQETESKNSGAIHNQEPFATERDQRTVLAMTNNNYPVTPGDVYSVSYLQSNKVMSINCMVNNDYTMNLGFFGVISGRGKTFNIIRQEIIDKISWAFPESFPDVKIMSTGEFECFLTGEVKKSQLVNAWGLTRLSDIVNANSTSYTSLRDITIMDPDGIESSYDLYKAWYDGDYSQNPLIKPGATVKFKQYKRTVTIEGEIKRPGKYQLTEKDTLSELVQYYGNGLTDKAYSDIIVIHQSASRQSESGGNTQYVNYPNEAETQLLNGDMVTVRSKEVFLPIFYIEGAINTMGDNSEALQASNTLPVHFKPNSKLSTLLFSNEQLFSDISDIENSYYIDSNTNTVKLVNIADIIYNSDLSNDLTIKNGDRLIVPFRQLFVTVNGAVTKPGRYPYVPDKSYIYYVNLAGGFDTIRNSGGAVTIYDDQNKRKGKDLVITQEDVIFAESNNFAYLLDEYSSIITVASTVVSLTISIITLLSAK